MTNWALATALPLAVSAAMATSPFIWEKRVIVMRADAASNAKFQQQRRPLLADRDALRERDLVVFAVLGEGAVEPVFGRAPTASTAEPLAGMLTVSGASQVALIGKDGGIKTTATKPLALKALLN
jgi:hypothetical protein